MGIRQLGLSAALVFTLGLAVPLPALAAAPVQIAPGQSCYGVHGRLVCNGHSRRPVYGWKCAYITRLDLEIAGWDMIFSAATVSAAGLFLDGTIAGIPVGAVVGLVGIGEGATGSFVLWYADSYFSPGWYCGYVRVR